MKLLNYSLSVLLLCLLCSTTYAQEQEGTQSIDEGSIGEQFDFVIKKSNNWTDDKGRAFEVIRRNTMQTLKTHAVDSVNAIKVRLDQTKLMVNKQQEEIATLKASLAKTQESLDATNQEKDSMSLLGAQMSKVSYSTLMWTIIAALLAGLLFFFFRFKNSNFVTKAAKAKLAEVEEDFKAHRKTALEREQKVKRQLQDEINKHRE